MPRPVGLGKDLFEIIHAGEVLAPVALGFPEDVVLNQVEDDLPEILRALHAPVREEGERHRAVLFQRVFADALQQFAARDVRAVAQ